MHTNPQEVKDRIDTDMNILITAGRPPREWQCIECGHVIEAKTRPKSCPDCNCVNGDFDPGINLYIRREACGWFE